VAEFRYALRVLPTRAQKRWAGRLRTAGALLMLIGTVALVDRLLPGGAPESIVTLPATVQLAVGAAALAAGAVSFAFGRRWR
jgi:hypothetical protein